jgi:hypothetical protein
MGDPWGLFIARNGIEMQPSKYAMDRKHYAGKTRDG